MSQQTWRRIGLGSLVVCGVMAWYGTKSGVTALEPPYQIAYWGVFLLSLLVALYMALLDLRYIRMQYRLGEKALYDDTLGGEEFRQALRGAREKRRHHDAGDD